MARRPKANRIRSSRSFTALSLATRIAIAMVAGLVAAAAFVVLSGDEGPSAPRLRAGDSPPDFVLPDLRDPSIERASSDLFGSPTIIAFLSSTCVPCRTELPILQEIADEHRDVSVLGVAHLEFRETALPFVDGLGIRFPVAHDEAGGTAVSWYVASLPATFFLDRSGRVVRAINGPASRAELESGVAAIVR